MAVYIEDNKLVITTGPKTIHFDLAEVVSKNLKHEIDSTIKHNDVLAEHTIGNRISR